MEALIFVPVGHERSNDCPFFRELEVELDEVLIFLGSPCLDFPFFGVQMLLLDLQVDLESVEALDRLAKLSGMAFFHI
jgi:hypothetical protein